MRIRTLSFLAMMTLALNLGVVDSTLAHERKYYANWETPIEPYRGFGYVVPAFCPLADRDAYVGVVCFPADHIVPDINGEASVTILDTVWPHASFGACQDQDLDLVCGESDTPANLHEYANGACNTMWLREAQGWDPSLPLYVVPDGPLTGSAFPGACRDVTLATFGVFSHS